VTLAVLGLIALLLAIAGYRRMIETYDETH
jgi:hypothetical protein